MPSDLEAIAAFLARQLRHPEGAARYRRFYEYSWTPDRPNLGYLIEEDRRIQGFIGAIYARRRIADEERIVCNINSWAVADSHRTLSLLMAKRLLDQPGMAFTCFSPSPRVVELLEFFKLLTWPTEKVLFSFPSGVARPVDSARARILLPGAGLEDSLDSEQRQIFEDHRSYRLLHLGIELGSRHAYVVLGRRGRGVKSFADVLYASDPELLIRACGRVFVHVAARLYTLLLGIDRRMISEVPFGAITYRGLRPLQYRGMELAQLDTLYSELVPICG